jgi:hypothetical protein
LGETFTQTSDNVKVLIDFVLPIKLFSGLNSLNLGRVLKPRAKEELQQW